MPRRGKPAGLSLRDARREMYRQRILTAAEYEFAKAGFDKTPMSAIAATADLSLATLYSSFAGKDDIWNALNAQRMNELVGMVREATDFIESPLERILVGARAQVDFFTGHTNFLRLHVNEGFSWATATQLGRGGQRWAWRTGIEMMTRAAQLAAEAGELISVDPAVAAKLAVSALQVWLTQWVEGGAVTAPGVLADELVDHLRRSLALPGTALRFSKTKAGRGGDRTA